MIKIANRRTTMNGVYVGRHMGSWCPGSVLGNPFYTKEDSERQEAIEKYEVWLRDQWREAGPVKDELVRLAQLYKEKQELTLICFCYPKRCHAEIIANAIRKLQDKI